MKKSNMENTVNKNRLARPIVLLGMMGAGKSSVGLALAKIMGVPFFDADVEIAAAAGSPPAQIFADYGEAEFRRLERQVIARLLQSEVCILSLGGGAFINDETRARVKETAMSVWLKVEADLLIQRVLRHGDRPMLKGGDPVEKMRRLLAEREPFYAQADLAVLCDDRPVPETAQRVYESIKSYMRL